MSILCDLLYVIADAGLVKVHNKQVQKQKKREEVKKDESEFEKFKKRFNIR